MDTMTFFVGRHEKIKIGNILISIHLGSTASDTNYLLSIN